ncbi:TonB-dependent receptor [Parvularcula oceani]|uniref:TonB-dependent receptor n=1 Tax=Parvularcula oceani TaxID=1247963 RepID=UPI00068E9D6C|nr:TonB-dependent receptor [Parvularcula oceani]
MSHSPHARACAALAASCAVSALLPAHAQEAPPQQRAADDVIVVTGSPLDRTQDELLAGASVLSGEELARQSASTIGETLRQEPGVSTTFFGAGASRPIIRGLGGDRVRILTNGIGSIDASSASPDHAVAVEPATAERIEVIRGTGLLRYGSSAAGGVVNVIDGRLPTEAPETGIEGALRVQGSTVDDGAEVAGGVTGLAGRIGGVDVVLHAAGTWRDAEDYEIPGFAESEALRALEEAEEEDLDHDEEEPGALENSFTNSASATGGLSFIGERGFLAVSIQDTNTRYGVPAGHAHEEHLELEEEHGEEEHEEEHAEEGGVFIDLGQTRYDLNAAYEPERFVEAIRLFAGYADYTHTEFEGPGEPGTVFSNEGYETRLEVTQIERDGWRGASGLQLRKRDFAAIGEEAFVPPTKTEQWGLYTFQEWRDGPLHLEGALRFETTEHERSTDGRTLDFDGLSASLGAGYDVADTLTLAATLLHTKRPPTSEELFSDGPHLATDAYELGDQTLGIETANGIEALAHLHGDRGYLTLNLFYTDYDDYVYERETGLFADELLAMRGVDDPEELEEFGELPVFQFTGADARFAGFELYGEYEFAEAGGFVLTADGVLDYVDAELTGVAEGEEEDLPRIPPLGLTGGIEADGYGLNLRAEVEYAGEQDDVTDFELPTDSYAMINLYASYALTDQLMLRAALLNANDEEARTHTSFLKDEVPLPGRNFRVSLGYAF